MSEALNAVVGCPFAAVGCTFNAGKCTADVVVFNKPANRITDLYLKKQRPSQVHLEIVSFYMQQVYRLMLFLKSRSVFFIYLLIFSLKK